MIMTIKRWAKLLGLNNPSGQGGPVSFSSYTFSIMIIGYLQVRHNLPVCCNSLIPFSTIIFSIEVSCQICKLDSSLYKRRLVMAFFGFVVEKANTRNIYAAMFDSIEPLRVGHPPKRLTLGKLSMDFSSTSSSILSKYVSKPSQVLV